MIPNIKELAHRQLENYRAKTPGMCFLDPGFLIDVKTAYALQDTVTNLRVDQGETIIGYKVGCTGPETTKQFGMQGPIRGTLFSEEAHKTGAKLDILNFSNLAIEAEMAIEIDTQGKLLTIFPVIELHNFVFRGPKKSLPELIGNNGINAGIVLPERHWRKPEKFYRNDSFITLYINDKKIGNSSFWPNAEGPNTSLDWLKANLKEYSLELTAGQIILAGTPLGLYPVQNGDEIAVHIDNEVSVECSVHSDL